MTLKQSAALLTAVLLLVSGPAAATPAADVGIADETGSVEVDYDDLYEPMEDDRTVQTYLIETLDRKYESSEENTLQTTVTHRFNDADDIDVDIDTDDGDAEVDIEVEGADVDDESHELIVEMALVDRLNDRYDDADEIDVDVEFDDSDVTVEIDVEDDVRAGGSPLDIAFGTPSDDSDTGTDDTNTGADDTNTDDSTAADTDGDATEFVIGQLDRTYAESDEDEIQAAFEDRYPNGEVQVQVQVDGEDVDVDVDVDDTDVGDIDDDEVETVLTNALNDRYDDPDDLDVDVDADDDELEVEIEIEQDD